MQPLLQHLVAAVQQVTRHQLECSAEEGRYIQQERERLARLSPGVDQQDELSRLNAAQDFSDQRRQIARQTIDWIELHAANLAYGSDSADASTLSDQDRQFQDGETSTMPSNNEHERANECTVSVQVSDPNV